MNVQQFLMEKDIALLEPADIDTIAESFGKDISKKIKTNQVRNFFSAVERLRANYKRENEVTDEMKRDLILLKPKMAYAAGKKKEVLPFYHLVKHAVDITVNSNNIDRAFNSFIRMIEAIVAYHKFYEENKEKEER